MFFLWDFSLTTTALFGFLTAIIAFYYYKLNYNHFWKYRGIEFHPPNLFFGTILALFRGKGFHEVDGSMYKKYGRLFGAYEGIRPILYVSDPEYLKMILVKDFYSFSNRREFTSGDIILDSMLSIMKGEDWKRVRSIVTPTFTTGKIKGMMTNVGQCATQSTQNFLKQADLGEIAECKKLFGNFTLDVIATVAFGTQLDSHNDPDNIFVTNARNVFNKDMSWRIVVAVMMPRLARLLGISFIQIDFFVALTKNIMERRRETKEVRHDFLQMMMDCLDYQDKKGNSAAAPILNESESNGNNEETKAQPKKKLLSPDEVVAQCVMFFLGGYDTTATTLSMVCYNLALNQESQRMAQQEIDEIWAKTPKIDAMATHDARYLEAIINETLRLFPPSVRLERTANEDYTLESSGLLIPKGTLVAIPTYSIHRDPEFFHKPDDFVPERFLAENNDSINKLTYLPFGAGPRNCIAMRFALMEIKLNLMYLLKEVHFDVCSETKIPPDFYNGNAFLQPRTVNLKVTRRNIA